MPKAKITALGCYTPPRVLTNFELEKMVQTSNQWILDRTGISERHIAAPEVATQADDGQSASPSLHPWT